MGTAAAAAAKECKKERLLTRHEHDGDNRTRFDVTLFLKQGTQTFGFLMKLMAGETGDHCAFGIVDAEKPVLGCVGGPPD